MGISDAQPMDIYIDAQGKLWRCVGVCSEPTVIFEEVEGHTPEPPSMIGFAMAQAGPAVSHRTPIIKDRKSGGITGLMWDGWQRIWRKE